MGTTEERFRAFFEGLEMQQIDELMGLSPEDLHEIGKTFAALVKKDKIRCFVQGAEYGWNESCVVAFDMIAESEAEDEARELLGQGKLGRERE